MVGKILRKIDVESLSIEEIVPLISSDVQLYQAVMFLTNAPRDLSILENSFGGFKSKAAEMRQLLGEFKTKGSEIQETIIAGTAQTMQFDLGVGLGQLEKIISDFELRLQMYRNFEKGLFSKPEIQSAFTNNEKIHKRNDAPLTELVGKLAVHFGGAAKVWHMLQQFKGLLPESASKPLHSADVVKSRVTRSANRRSNKVMKKQGTID